MNADELVRNVPANIHELRLALAGLPKNTNVKAHFETGVSEKIVDELRARATWPAGLVLTTPRELKPKSVVKISKAPGKILSKAIKNLFLAITPAIDGTF